MVEKKYWVPNLFTGLNFLLGVGAIMMMAETFTSPAGDHPVMGFTKEPIIVGAWMIIWCALFDKLDGFAARILKASSDFGAQFDSLADLTAFGIAPGFLVYFYMQFINYDWFAAHRPLMIISMAIHVLGAATRLARYNAIDTDELKDYFHGLPTTFAGSFIAISTILFHKYDLTHRIASGNLILPLMLIFTGILMVSPLYLPKLLRRKNKLVNTSQVANVLVGYVCGFGMILPELLYVQGLIYGILGFGYGLLKKGTIDAAKTPSPE
jgi:CDP-diacylglycerol---serine O-phosphatidyltransferase